MRPYWVALLLLLLLLLLLHLLLPLLLLLLLPLLYFGYNLTLAVAVTFRMVGVFFDALAGWGRLTVVGLYHVGMHVTSDELFHSINHPIDYLDARHVWR